MKVIKGELGKWLVVSAEGKIISEHVSNAAAWRALDRLQMQPVSRAESVGDWASRQVSKGLS